MDTVMDNIQRFKLLGKILLNQNKNAFIRKINGDLHFCEIIFISENSIKIKNFGPEQRKDREEEIYWVQISEFDEFKEEGK